MVIRKAVRGDASRISKVYAASWREAYRGMIPADYLETLRDDHWKAAFEQWLDAGTLDALVAQDGETLAGCAAFGAARDEKMAGWGEIVSIYLLPRYFGTGIGGPLFDAALSELSKMGFEKAYLWVLQGNRRAERFYRKRGFEPNGDELTENLAGSELVNLRYVGSSILPLAGFKK